MVFAGIWQDWEQDGQALTTCAIVTTDANEAMAPIHHRLPVILTPDQWALWLGEAGKGAATCMKSAPEDALSFQMVSTKVNSNRATGPDLITPI
jgi:putative SOS response-associated peptidase YedK